MKQLQYKDKEGNWQYITPLVIEGGASLPEDGKEGLVLTKTEDGTEWRDNTFSFKLSDLWGKIDNSNYVETDGLEIISPYNKVFIPLNLDPNDSRIKIELNKLLYEAMDDSYDVTFNSSQGGYQTENLDEEYKYGIIYSTYLLEHQSEFNYIKSEWESIKDEMLMRVVFSGLFLIVTDPNIIDTTKKDELVMMGSMFLVFKQIAKEEMLKLINYGMSSSIPMTITKKKGLTLETPKIEKTPETRGLNIIIDENDPIRLTLNTGDKRFYTDLVGDYAEWIYNLLPNEYNCKMYNDGSMSITETDSSLNNQISDYDNTSKTFENILKTIENDNIIQIDPKDYLYRLIIPLVPLNQGNCVLLFLTTIFNLEIILLQYDFSGCIYLGGSAFKELSEEDKEKLMNYFSDGQQHNVKFVKV